MYIILICVSSLCLGVLVVIRFFFFKQKTAYEMRISDWSSDVCSSDLARPCRRLSAFGRQARCPEPRFAACDRSGFATGWSRLRRSRSATGRPSKAPTDRKSVVQGKSVQVRVDLGGRGLIKNKYIRTRLSTSWTVQREKNKQNVN